MGKEDGGTICAEQSGRNCQTIQNIWGHCPGKENPADLPSRGLTPTELSTSALWRFDLPWIQVTGDKPLPEPVDMPSDCAIELKVAAELVLIHC